MGFCSLFPAMIGTSYRYYLSLWMVPAGSVDGWSSGYKTASSGRSLPRQVAANSCTARLSASPRQIIVPNPGEGSRPVSILRRVSGEMPAACATSARSRPARAWRSSAPRRLPASICSGVSGWRTMLPGYGLVLLYRQVLGCRYSNTSTQ
jgi:hypothetical protein